MRKVLLICLMMMASTMCFGADSYPTRPIRLVVSFAPGSTDDIVARLVSQQLSTQLPNSIFVENRVGATGTIGNDFVAKSPPDGYTVLLTDTASTIFAGLSKSLPYDWIKDFAPITQLTRSAQVLVVLPSSKINSVKDLIALAQANPGKLNYGSGGIGGAVHLSTELFKMISKVNIVHVPYKGGAGDAMTGLLGGQVQMLMTAIPTVIANIKNGQLRALAVTTDGKRVPSLPDVPSMSEAGVPGVVAYIEFGLAVPAATPKDAVNKLNAEVVKAVNVPSVKEQFAMQGAEVVGSSPEEFAQHQRSEFQRWGTVIKTANISLD